jgi:DNA replication protein DnaC
LRFQDRTLDRFVVTHVAQERALCFARAYVAQFDQVLTTGRSAIFVGKPGTGKTHLAAGIGLALMARHYHVLFLTVLRALRLVKDTWSRGSEWTESEVVARLARPDLLILDEIGMQFGSRTEENILFDVLNERYESRRPTLLISNLVVDEVRDVMGERIWDRLREDGGDIVTFDWVSYRGKL